MSLRYTGEATMDEPALRDVERWKDKIEVRLDNRQVFFLFFGSAMVACLLFVLGVIVGKRLETRGRAEAPAIEDPLAVLDRFGVAPAPVAPPAELTFPRALTGGAPSKSKAAATSTLTATAPAATVAVAGAAAPVGASAGAGPRIAPAPVAAAPSLPPKKASALPRLLPQGMPVVRAKAEPSAPSATAASAVAGPTTPVAAHAPTAVRAPAASRAAASQPGTTKEPTQAAKTATGGATKVAGVPADKSKGRFLLQLSSFQDRSEADAFSRRFAGKNAYVVATEIPGKGTWYRVRVGSYGSMQEATLAKTAFEREHSVIAYVAGGGPAK